MANITAMGTVGKVIFVPANEEKGTDAVLNVGILEKYFVTGKGTRSKWYQACWTGKEALKKQKIMDNIRAIGVTGKEDFRIKQGKDGPEIERVIWVDTDMVVWKEKDQLEMNI
ncbi:MAG: hypothetical protein JWM44_2064 [Bacilli bacterium]|nr:hypothetical protein [Bacilli bacterium]